MTTGSAQTQTRHSPTMAWLGLMISMGIPAAVLIAGVIALGPGAISWIGAIVWGIVATVVFTLASMMGKAMGMTRMDLLDLLGSMAAPPHTGASRALGAVIHHVNGAILAVAWAYGVAMVGLPANWLTALVWGVILWALALIMMSSIGLVHPAVRSGEQDDPGPAATNFGAMTPAGSLIGHAVYGVCSAWATGSGRWADDRNLPGTRTTAPPSRAVQRPERR